MKHSIQGFSLIETVLASTVLLITILGVASSMNYFYRDFSKIKLNTALNRSLNNIISIMEIRLSNMEITFNNSVNIDMDPSTFPYYWDSDYEVMDKEECLEIFKQAQSCPLAGRIYYLIQPMSHLSNIFETKVYFYHPELNNGVIREFDYVLSVK